MPIQTLKTQRNETNQREIALAKAYKEQVKKTGELEEETPAAEEQILTYGLQELRKRRLVPLGKITMGPRRGKPFFMKYPELTDTTYNVFTFVSPMGGGKSTNVRSIIYYTYKFDPDCITIIFDPMKMEYSKLAIKQTEPEAVMKKKIHLINETLHDPAIEKPIQIEIDPDNLQVFHVIPRFAIKRQMWNDKEMRWEEGFDNTTLQILGKDGGYVFAEDVSTMSEPQLFSCLNYRELRSNHALHYYLRQGIALCNLRYGRNSWYIGDLIAILREGVKKYRQAEEVDDLDEAEEDKKTGLSSNELQLIEQLEKYNDVGFFVRDEAEKKKYAANFRKFIRIGKIINISYMGFKKTEKIGEDIIVGQTDLILERLIAIADDFYDGVRKKEAGLPLSDWEIYLQKKWRVSLWFEESEIFIPRDCPTTDIKKWPCIKRLDSLMSTGRKFGFKNFGFITQRIQKVNHIIFEESNNIFIGPIIGDERDKIISDFGVQKWVFPRYDNNGRPILGPKGEPVMMGVRDVISTLKKENHEWVYLCKGTNEIAPISTYDSPCG